MIADKIKAYLEGPGNPVSPEAIARATEAIAVSLARNFGATREDIKTPFRASSLGKCPRAGYYMLKGEAAEPLSGRSKMVFTFGDTIEAQAIALMYQAGVPVVGTQVDVAMDVASVNVTGHVDAVLVGGIPVEIKSMSSKGFDEAEKLGFPDNSFGYLDQLQFYMRALAAPHGYFLCINKEQGHIAEYRIERDDETYLPRAEAYVRGASAMEAPSRPYATEPEIYKVQGKAKAEEYSKATNLPMPTNSGSWYGFRTGRQTLGKICGYCAYKLSCFKGLSLEVSGSGAPNWVVPKEVEK